MKQCNGDYEAAMHYDCEICNENCKYRKGNGSPIILIAIFISLFIIGKVLSLLGVW